MVHQLARASGPKPSELAGDLLAWRRRWMTSLRARKLAATTLTSYGKAFDRLIGWLEDAAGRPRNLADVTTEHLEQFFGQHLEATSAATAAITWRSLQQLFKFHASRNGNRPNPMAKLGRITVPDAPVPVLRPAEVRAILDTCAGRDDFISVRDTALLRLFIDTGGRLSELTKLTVDMVDVAAGEITVLGKGSRTRSIALDPTTVEALHRYLYLRTRHKDAARRDLWLGGRGKGPISNSGVYQMIAKRAATAGLDVHPHQFRHTFAHAWLEAGGSEGGLMSQAGWASRSMLDRYGKHLAGERGQSEKRRLNLSDRL